MTSIPQTELDAFVNRTRATASESLNISALSRFAYRVAGTPSANAGAVALAEISGATTADALWSAWCRKNS